MSGRALLVLGLCALLCLRPASACSDLPEICAANAQHHQDMMEQGRLAAEAYADSQYEEYGDDGGDGYVDPGPPSTYDPMQVHLALAVSLAERVAAEQDALDKLQRDPRYQRYQDGGWDYFQDQQQAPAGEYCAAFYWKQASFVRLSGPGGGYAGALLTFWGSDIPRPTQVEKVRVTLTQDDEAPQTVMAFNYRSPGYDYGAIALAVPSIEAALDTMLDRQRFRLEIDGRTVAQAEWHDGMKARDWLRECVAKRSANGSSAAVR
jgi:hypothetical protein